MREFDELIRFVFLRFYALEYLANLMTVELEEAGQLAFAVKSALPCFACEKGQTRRNRALGLCRVDWLLRQLAQNLTRLFIRNPAIGAEPVPGSSLRER